MRQTPYLADYTPHFHAIRRWIGQGFWAIMDQGLFAGSNFIMNVLLARWLVPADYGAYAVAYAVFLLFGTFHTAIFTEPMLVFGPGKYKDQVSAYVRILLKGHWIFGGIMAALFAVTGICFRLFSDSPLAPAMLGLIIAAPCTLFQWLMRRACYINLKPQWAATAGTLYMALMLAGIYGINRFGLLNATAALLVMGIASAASGLWLVYKLNVLTANKSKDNLEIARTHWKYGKWAVGTAGLGWLKGNVFQLFLPLWWGLEASAIYKALINLLLPMMNVTMALGGIILPTLVRRRGTATFSKLIISLVVLFTLAGTVHWLLLSIFAIPITNTLYAGKYTEYASLLWIAGLIPIVASITSVTGSALRALELPKKIFIALSCSTITALTVGLWLIYTQCLHGAIYGYLATHCVAAFITTLTLMLTLSHYRQGLT